MSVSGSLIDYQTPCPFVARADRLIFTLQAIKPATKRALKAQ